jgi:acetyl esterase/lipase
MSLRAQLLRRFIGRMGKFGEVPLEEMRATMQKFALPLPTGVTVTAVNDLSAQWVVPSQSTRGVLLYLHGGGYVQKSDGMHLPLVARIALAAQVKVLYVDYRLAPEHPFPAALDDALAAYRWLQEQHIPPEQIIFGGDSAGGGLALAALAQLRDQQQPLPAAAVLLSPWCDLALQTPIALQDRDPQLTRVMLLRFAQHYADQTPLDHPLLSPIHADLTGLPPLLIQAGELEILRGEAEAVTQRAQAVGVSVQLSIYPQLWHVWQIYPPWLLPETGTAIQEIARFIQQRFA